MGNHYQTSMGIIPLWIMLGTQGPPERPCRLWASAVLTKAELITRITHVDLLTMWDPWQPISHDAELRAFMPAHDIVIIDAGSWGACIAELMRIWTPEGGRMPERGEIGGPRPLDGPDRPPPLPAG